MRRIALYAWFTMVTVFAFAGPAHARFAGPAEAISGLLAVSIAAASTPLLSSALAAMLVCGLLLIPLIYDVVFYRILGQRFILLHAAMMVAMLGFALTSSSLAPVLFPEAGQEVIGRLNLLLFVISCVCALLFGGDAIEPHHRNRFLDFNLIGAVALILAITIIALVAGLEPYLDDNPRYLLTFFVPTGVLIAITILAIGNGSRTSKWVAFGLSGLLAAALALLLDASGAMDIAIRPTGLVLLSIVVFAVTTSLGVGDSFLAIREDRDSAMQQATQMGRMAQTDGLTGLLNRRAFELVDTLHPGEGLLVADIDRFKPINDTYGHQTGDAVLRHTANVMREAMTAYSEAEIYRLGGEEFAILCPAERASQLMTIAEEVREMVAGEIIDLGDEKMPPYTISIGAVIGRGQPMDQAFAEADSALYGAKAMGRDRSVLYRHNPATDDSPMVEQPPRIDNRSNYGSTEPT